MRYICTYGTCTYVLHTAQTDHCSGEHATSKFMQQSESMKIYQEFLLQGSAVV